MIWIQPTPCMVTLLRPWIKHITMIISATVASKLLQAANSVEVNVKKSTGSLETPKLVQISPHT